MILNWLIDGLRRLVNNNKFTFSTRMTETKRTFKRASDPIGAFIDEQCLFGPTQKITKKELYETYKQFCTDELDEPAEGQGKVTRRINTLNIKEIQINKERGWAGIGLRGDQTPILDTHNTENTPTSISLENGDKILSKKNKNTVISVLSVSDNDVDHSIDDRKDSVNNTKPHDLPPALQKFEEYMIEHSSVGYLKAMVDLEIKDKKVLDDLVEATPSVEYRGASLIYLSHFKEEKEDDL